MVSTYTLNTITRKSGFGEEGENEMTARDEHT